MKFCFTTLRFSGFRKVRDLVGEIKYAFGVQITKLIWSVIGNFVYIDKINL